MRVYVLYERNRPVFVPLLALWLSVIAVGCVRVLVPSQWEITGSMIWPHTVGSVLQQSLVTHFSGLHDPITT